MDTKHLNKIIDFLYQYKTALTEKVMEKISEFGGVGEEIQYSLGNFAVEDFMDNNAMRLSHLNVLIMELQHQLDEQTVQYERLCTEVHEIPKDQLKTKIKYYIEGIPPSDLRWVNLEKIAEDTYYLIVIKREDV